MLTAGGKDHQPQPALFVDAGGQALAEPGLLPVRKTGRGLKVKPEGDSAVDLVDVLTAGAGAAGKGEAQFMVGDGEVWGDPGHGLSLLPDRQGRVEAAETRVRVDALVHLAVGNQDTAGFQMVFDEAFEAAL